MTKRKMTKGQTMIYKTLHRKLQIELTKHTKNRWWTYVFLKDKQILFHKSHPSLEQCILKFRYIFIFNFRDKEINFLSYSSIIFPIVWGIFLWALLRGLILLPTLLEPSWEEIKLYTIQRLTYLQELDPPDVFDSLDPEFPVPST